MTVLDTLEVRICRPELDDWLRTVAHLADAVVEVNELWLRARADDRPMRRLYMRAQQPKVRRDGRAVQVLRTASQLEQDGAGNCLELACYLAALIRLGHDRRPQPHVVIAYTGGSEAHAIVRCPLGLADDHPFGPVTAGGHLDPAQLFPSSTRPTRPNRQETPSP